MRKVTHVWGSRDQNFDYLYYVGDIDVTGTYAEDVAVTSHQDVSTSVPVGESTHEGFMDADQDDKSSIDKQMIR